MIARATPVPPPDQISFIHETEVNLGEERVIQALGSSTKRQDMNRIQYGVRYPTAITEALIGITYPGSKVKRPRLDNIILKVNTGASVSLAHLDYLTDIRDCRLQGLPPVQLNGIGATPA